MFGSGSAGSGQDSGGGAAEGSSRDRTPTGSPVGSPGRYRGWPERRHVTEHRRTALSAADDRGRQTWGRGLGLDGDVHEFWPRGMAELGERGAGGLADESGQMNRPRRRHPGPGAGGRSVVDGRSSGAACPLRRSGIRRLRGAAECARPFGSNPTSTRGGCAAAQASAPSTRRAGRKPGTADPPGQRHPGPARPNGSGCRCSAARAASLPFARSGLVVASSCPYRRLAARKG